MKKVAIFSALLAAPLLIATAIWLVPAVIEAVQNAKYMSGFTKINEAKTPLTVTQVEDAMGRPARIEQSESADQTVNGAVYHYPAHGQDMEVIFVNGNVLRTQFVPEVKS